MIASPATDTIGSANVAIRNAVRTSVANYNSIRWGVLNFRIVAAVAILTFVFTLAR